MSDHSAVVIGAGIVGLAAARALALNGYAVDLFERNPVATGASIRNFGMVWPVGQPEGELYDRALRTRHIWEHLAREAGIWFDPVGSLHVAHTEDEWTVLQEIHEQFHSEGRAVEILDAAALHRKSAIAIQKTAKGGLYSPDELIVDPRQAIRLLPAYLSEKYPIRFHWGKPVTQISGGQVMVEKKKMQADLIIICSGADFETLYPAEFAAYPLTKCKLQMMRFVQEEKNKRIGAALCGGLSLIHYNSFKRAPSWEKLKHRFEKEMPDYIRKGIHVMVSQNETGELTIGDSHEYGLSPDPFDRQEINQLILEYFWTFAGLKNARFIESWNGVYAKLTNGGADLFFSPEPGVYILNATGGAGMTLSFGLAEDRLKSILF
jgi:FAD dependent oxidoreductase TIGR03364